MRNVVTIFAWCLYITLFDGIMPYQLKTTKRAASLGPHYWDTQFSQLLELICPDDFLLNLQINDDSLTFLAFAEVVQATLSTSKR